MLLKLRTYNALQSVSSPPDIYFEESKINELLLGECYSFVISFSFISRILGIVFPVNNLLNRRLVSIIDLLCDVPS